MGNHCRTNLEQFKNVVSYIEIHKFGIQASEVRIVDVLKDQGRRLALAISHHIQKRNDVRPTGQVLKYLDLSLYLLLFDGLEHFDNAFLIIDDVYAFEDLGVFSSA